MDFRKVMLLIGALAIAAATAIMARNMFAGSAAPQAQAQAAIAGPEVLVATRPLPVGTIIDAEALRFQPWPEGLVEDAYFIKGKPASNIQDLLGTVVRSDITAGQPITQGALVKPGERGFLAAALGPGMRAVTVAVNMTSGVAGFIFPGDRVDIMLSQDVEGGGDGPPLKVAETILSNVRVLAVDQRMQSFDEKGKPIMAALQNVTMEVTPRIAEKISVAQSIGRISLSLRSLADNSADLDQAIASGQVDVPEGMDPKTERRVLAAMAARPFDGGTATVGADVSRYQRSTVPPKPASAAPPPPPPPAAMLQAAMGGSNGVSQAPVRPRGPVVRVARGEEVSEVSVGGR